MSLTHTTVYLWKFLSVVYFTVGRSEWSSFLSMAHGVSLLAEADCSGKSRTHRTHGPTLTSHSLKIFGDSNRGKIAIVVLKCTNWNGPETSETTDPKEPRIPSVTGHLGVVGPLHFWIDDQ